MPCQVRTWPCLKLHRANARARPSTWQEILTRDKLSTKQSEPGNEKHGHGACQQRRDLQHLLAFAHPITHHSGGCCSTNK